MSENTKKKKTLTAALAVGLAAIMAIGGGTFAYLQGESQEVKNDFKTNQVTVDLDETTGNDYNIIPGTSQPKDPKVTVTNTIDAYVFVEVTDATDGLVTYDIADGWTKLDGYDNIYYREVSANADVKEFDVLKDNTVSYDAKLLNSDMVDENGVLKEGIALTFKAYAIQKTPFNSPTDAFKGKDAAIVDDPASLQEEIDKAEDGDTIILNNDITTTEPLEVAAPEDDLKEITVDLNGNTIKSEHSYWYMYVDDHSNINFKNGTIDCCCNGFWVENSAKLTLDNVTLNAKGLHDKKGNPNEENEFPFAIYTRTSGVNEGVTITLNDSVINSKTYGIASYNDKCKVIIDGCDINTNGFGVYQHGNHAPSTYTIRNSNITDTASAGIFISNSVSNGTLQTMTIENSTVTGPTAVELKHTNATITGSTLIASDTEVSSVINGTGTCTSGYALAVTSNKVIDYVTGTVNVVDSQLYTGSAEGQPNGKYFVFQPADGASVTINGTLVQDYGTYAG